MPTVFTSIIEGKLPGRFVWEDDLVVGFLTIAPISPGHTLVVPRMEVDHWLDADPGLLSHAIEVARSVGTAIHRAFRPRRVALLVAGFEVPHMHLHVLGAGSEADIKFENADPDVPGAELDKARDRVRVALDELGFGESVPRR